MRNSEQTVFLVQKEGGALFRLKHYWGLRYVGNVYILVNKNVELLLNIGMFYIVSLSLKLVNIQRFKDNLGPL